MVELAVVLWSAIPRIVEYMHLAVDKCIARKFLERFQVSVNVVPLDLVADFSASLPSPGTA